MAIAKVILNNTTLMDVTQKTVDTNNLQSGFTAMKNNGIIINGSIVGKTASDITISNGVANIASGVYFSDVEKAIPIGSATIPNTSINIAPNISFNSSTGVITASFEEAINITPSITSGYISSCASGSLSINGSATYQLSTQGSMLITPTESIQTIPLAGLYTVGDIKVDAISSTYVGTGVSRLSSSTYMPGTSDQIIPSGYYLEGEQTILGDPFLIAGNIKKDVSIFGVTGTFELSGNNEAMEDWLITDELPSEYSSSKMAYTNNNITIISNYAFASMSTISYINCPNCSIISHSAFYSCTYLMDFSFPNCQIIGQNAFTRAGVSTLASSKIGNITLSQCTTISGQAFQSCQLITQIDLPICSIILYSTFQSCSYLSSVNLPMCTSLGSNAFYGCRSLKFINIPKVESIASSCFFNCTALIQISLPECTFINNNAFFYCTSLQSAYLPKCSLISGYAFADANKLVSIDLPECTKLSTGAFARCNSLSIVSLYKCSYIDNLAFQSTNLLSLYLYMESVPLLSSTSVFQSSPLRVENSGSIGSIYVPLSLLSSYQNANIWSMFSSYFVGI